MNLARLGYCVSFFSYLFFLMLEYLRPGFVSNYLSVHLFLIPAIIFGILWARKSPSYPFSSFLFPLSISILFSVFTWREGRAFEDYRVLMTLVAFFLPMLVWRQVQK